jgi:hypothetical protein
MYLSLGFSKYCNTSEKFAQIIQCKLLWYYEQHFENDNALIVGPLIQVALALDRTGQQITRPLHCTHWTINQLCKNEPRSPMDCQHSTLMSYILSVNPKSKDVVGALLDLQLHSMTAGQRRFLLESVFVPGLYIHYDDVDWQWSPEKIHVVTELIRNLMDVNEPVRRVKCSLDYSIWQIFLLWLHGEDCWTLCDEDVDIVVIVQAFLSYGADPCAVVSSKDLTVLKFEKENECTLDGDAALISATELLEDIKEHTKHILCLQANMEAEAVHATIECAQRLLANATQGSSRHR